MHRAVAAATLIGLSWVAYCDYCPPDSAASGGMRDIMLAYIGPNLWAQEDFLPYVAYLDKAAGGQPRDWFYDAFLFLMHGYAPSGGGYQSGTATKADWDYYLDTLFAPNHCLAALDACIAQVGGILKQKDRVCPVIIMIPYLSKEFGEFGDVDGDGQPENPKDDADRLKAFKWIVEAVLERWKAHSYAHLKLWGFYWMNEGISGADEALVRAVADYVQSRGYGFHWIPWFLAPGHERWRELGLDFVIMQPNFAFTKVPHGAAVPDEERLTQNANIARALGMGVEMELNSNVAHDPGQRLNLQLYLNHGVDELDGYMKSAVRAYYQGYDFIAQLYRSDLPDCNQLYDDLYRFHKGVYQRRAVSLCEGDKARLNGEPAPKLTDGLWMTRDEHADRLLMASTPATIDIELGATEVVGDVRVHVATRDQGTPTAPAKIRVLTGLDGHDLIRQAEAPCPVLHSVGAWKTGFAILTFEPRPTKTLRIELTTAQQAQIAVDEVAVYPAPHLLSGVRYHIEGSLLPETEAASRTVLADGRLFRPESRSGAVRFLDGRGRISFELSEEWYLARALAHAWWPPDSKPPQCRVVMSGADGQIRVSDWISGRSEGQGWLEIPLPAHFSRKLTFELAGGPDVLWDELQVRRAPNLAYRKPYRIEPAFAQRYPDTNGTELTDGVLTDQGFGDGKTVGWLGQEVTIILDLGSQKLFDAVQAHVQGGGYAAVYYPTAWEVWVSGDGEDWGLLTGDEVERQVTKSETVGGETNELAWLRMNFSPTSARYVMLRFRSRSWLMISEIQVLAGQENLAAGCAYHLSPAPTSEQRYADDSARLTDGDYSRPSDGWAKAVGWNRADPVIVVDLLRTREVSVVRAHVLGGGNGAVFFPQAVSVSTSVDGEEWTQEVVTTQAPPEAGNQSLVAFMSVRLDTRPARYVRLSLKRKGWVMIDEIEVH